MIKTPVTLFLITVFLATSGCIQNSSHYSQPGKGMILIPAGEFLMGIDHQPVLLEVMMDKIESKDATPEHVQYLDTYAIDAFETSYGRYAQYKTALQSSIAGKENYPVSGITWHQAEEFCQWAGKRLPTEAEWEKAARGTDGRIYPWGNTFNPQFANFGEKIMRIGSFIIDRSPYGVFDMGGNVSEWTASRYKPYPESTKKNDLYEKEYWVTRGGSFSKSGSHSYSEIFSQTTYRHTTPPNSAAFDNGFRCVQGKGT